MAQKRRCTAIILAAGSGSRMKSRVAKQFMELGGKPLIWYALEAAERSAVIDDCVLVAGERDIPYVEREIVKKYRFAKVRAIVAGGAERYLSVEKGLEAIASGGAFSERDGFVFICDGARPFLAEEMLERLYEAVEAHHACVAAVRSKDTVKLADADGFAAVTPDRDRVWTIQTPQVFDVELAIRAYRRFREARETAAIHGESQAAGGSSFSVTDDAGVVERYTDVRVKLVEASYRNIKITTPEDLLVAEAFLKEAQIGGTRDE